MDSYVYRDLGPEVAAKCGYFEPKENPNIIRNFDGWNFRPDIDGDTQIIFFPGSFGTFHEGHKSIAEAALKKYPGAKLVISPANSDYAVQKYGKWSEHASNKHRYDAIKRMMPEAIIDLDSMLYFTCDQNFTDLLENFLWAQGLSIGWMSKTPIILCGKDRADFLNLNNHTSAVKVEWFEDTTGASTSSLQNRMRSRKKLLLRCRTREEYLLFLEYFADQYESGSPIFLYDELAMAAQVAANFGMTHTICKEYAQLLPYIPLSRTFTNPLEDATFPESHPHIQPGMKILDSDIYSGATRNFVVDKCGASLTVLFNLETMNDSFELLDIDDFRKEDFCYPFVDISSRCSMQAFDYEFHQRYNAFREALRNV